LNVLIVDGTLTRRTLLSHQLTLWGMQCSIATGRSEPLTLLRDSKDQNPFTLIILDEQWPHTNVPALVTAIKSDPAIADIKIMLLSSPHQPQEQNNADGIWRALRKPVRQTRLLMYLLRLVSEPSTTTDEPITVFPGRPKLPRLNAHVLVAEDNPVNQTVVEEMLRELGCRVDIVANGSKAVEAAKQHRYDLILMDVQMPELDGYQATAVIRNQENEAGTVGTAPVPIIAVTANALAGSQEECLAAGMNDYISKPFRQSQLAALLQRWLSAAA
ncbi:MAG: response regulator, partial [Candidatus Competibacteraceae bacterium]